MHKTKNLTDIFHAHQGKFSDKWEIYLREYDRIFSEYRDMPLRLLEIGISHGGSLEVWDGYFNNAEILIGCDISIDCGQLTYDSPKIKVVIGDANSDIPYEEIVTLSPVFDLIIDDGSHRSGDMIRSFSRYFQHVVDGGLYVIEDMHCSYWDGWQGGLQYELSSMNFFKKLADCINSEHWGTGYTRGEFLKNFSTHYQCTFNELALSHIHSIEFANSMCFIKKADPVSNVLGKRLLGGLIPLVRSTSAEAKGTDEIAHENAFKDSVELTKLRAELDSLYKSHSWKITKPLRWLRNIFN